MKYPKRYIPKALSKKDRNTKYYRFAQHAVITINPSFPIHLYIHAAMNI